MISKNCVNMYVYISQSAAAVTSKHPKPWFAVNQGDNITATVKFFEDGTGVILNGTSLRIQFDYNFTERSEAGLN
jgi:hypothetical protein